MNDIPIPSSRLFLYDGLQNLTMLVQLEGAARHTACINTAEEAYANRSTAMKKYSRRQVVSNFGCLKQQGSLMHDSGVSNASCIYS